MDLKSGLGAFLQGAGGMGGLQNAAQQGAPGMGLGGLADLLKQRVMAEQLLREKLQEPMSRGQDQSFVPRVPTPDVPMPGNEPMGMGRAPSPGMFGGNVSTTSEYRGSEPGSQEYFDERLRENAGKSGMDYDGYYQAKDWMERTEPSPEQQNRQQEMRALESDINYWMSQPDSDEKMYQIQEIQRKLDRLKGAE